MFMLGIGYSLFHVTDRRHLLVQGWFWSGVLLGGALVVLPATSAYRILVVFPAVCIFVALGCDRLLSLALGAPLRGASEEWNRGSFRCPRGNGEPARVLR